MSTLLFSRGSVIVTSGLKFRVLQPQFFENGHPLLARSSDVLKVGSVRGVRGTRAPVDISAKKSIVSTGITLVKGEDLLKQLEEERSQLRMAPLTKSNNRPIREDQQIEKKPEKMKGASNAPDNKSRFPQPQPKNKLLKEADTDKLVVTSENQFDVLNRVICPLLSVPYDEQLQMKTELHLNIVRRLNKLSPGSKICKPAGIIPSESLTEYRTKDEFGIQRGLDGNPKTVGFFVGSSKSRLLCIDPRHVPIIKDAHVRVASAFQDYIRSSGRAAHLDPNDAGFWRGLIVRSDRKSKDVMATILIRTEGLSLKEVENEKSKLGNFFRDGSGREANLTTLYVQKYPIDIGGGKKTEPELVFGPPRIPFKLFEHQFQVGPTSYLPGNLSTEENILKIIRSNLNVNHVVEKSSNFLSSKRSKKVTLFDVGCGVGMYSIIFSKNVRSCVGFDLSVDDAKHNAEILGVADNCEFVAGSFIKTVPKYFRNLENEAGLGIVILNPGRQGVDRLLISQIRDCRHVKKVIYISSNPEGDSFYCFRDLCKEMTKETKKNRFCLVPISEHFWLKFSAAVDSYPHTPHCQHVFVFTRK